MNTFSKNNKAKVVYRIVLILPLLVYLTSSAVATKDYGHPFCLREDIFCGVDGRGYANYGFGLLPSMLWYLSVLIYAFVQRDKFVISHGIRAFFIGIAQIAIILLGMYFDVNLNSKQQLFYIALITVVISWFGVLLFHSRWIEGNPPQQEVITKILTELKSDNIENRRAAAQVLARSASPTDIPLLIELAEDPDEIIRSRAIARLQRDSSPKAKEFIVSKNISKELLIEDIILGITTGLYVLYFVSPFCWYVTAASLSEGLSVVALIPFVPIGALIFAWQENKKNNKVVAIVIVLLPAILAYLLISGL